MGEKTLSELCEEAHEEAMNGNVPVHQPESDNAYAHEEEFEPNEEQKDAIESILSDE